MSRARCLVVLLAFAIHCLLFVATAGGEELSVAGASVGGGRRLRSSGGIGAFSPPAPGFSRTGNGNLSTTPGVLLALVSFIVLLFL